MNSHWAERELMERRRLRQLRRSNAIMPEKPASLKHNAEHRARQRWKREHGKRRVQ